MSSFCMFASLKEESLNKKEFVDTLVTLFNRFYENVNLSILIFLIIIAVVSLIFSVIKLHIENRESRRIYFISIIEEYLNTK